MADMRSSKQLRDRWKEELEPLMDNFMTQINNLNERNREFSSTIEGIRVENLDEEMLLLREKQEKAATEKASSSTS